MIKNNDKFVLAADCGGSLTKIKTRDTRKTISSKKGIITHNFNLKRDFRDDDYLIEIDGKKYGVAGLSEESRMQMKMFSKSKQNVFYDLSLLMAVHLYGAYENYVSIVVPVDSMNTQERDGLYNRLVKEWGMTINGVYREFKISDLKVFPEGATAFFKNRPLGKTRWIDLGSRTLNYATVVHDDKGVRFLNSESGTLFNAGLEAMGVTVSDYTGGEEIANFAAGHLLSLWNQEDQINIVGGGARNRGFIEGLRAYFPNVTVENEPSVAALEGLYDISLEVYGVAKR